jgi:hypothetical protein
VWSVASFLPTPIFSRLKSDLDEADVPPGVEQLDRLTRAGRLDEPETIHRVHVLGPAIGVVVDQSPLLLLPVAIQEGRRPAAANAGGSSPTAAIQPRRGPRCTVRMAAVVLSSGRTGLARFWLHGNHHRGTASKSHFGRLDWFYQLTLWVAVVAVALIIQSSIHKLMPVNN